MTLKTAVFLTFAALTIVGCKEDKPPKQVAQADASENKVTETAKPSPKSSSAKSVYFVCQMNSERVNYLSELIEMKSPRTNEDMAKSFEAKIATLDRTYYPLPEGDAITYTCTSDTDVRKMLDLSLDLRGMNEGATVSAPFRTVTGWKP
mgnify:CR=1 FL=1